MNSPLSSRSLYLIVVVAILVSACAILPAPPSLFDLGPLRPASSTISVPPPLAVADVQAPPWLDGQRMYYRLDYINELQPRAYVSSRWMMAPGALLTQRLKARLSQAGGIVVSPADGGNLPVLRVELEDFMQTFPDQQHSAVHVALRASLFRGHILLSQKNIVRHASAPTADASGGAAAFASATDAAINDIIMWLAQQPLAK